MSIWLPLLATERLTNLYGAAPENRPLAVWAKVGNAFVLTATDGRAAGLGLRPGMPLADARAIAPDLVAHEAEPDADLQALDRLAAWCERFTPSVALDPPCGLFLDLSGCAHLFGGEAAMVAEIRSGLRARGFTSRLAIAPTAGAAWAFARHGGARIVDADGLRAALSPLPVAALRLEPPAAALLKRLGVKRIGQILDAPRAPLAARAGESALTRLDQALGRVPEGLSMRHPAPPAFALRRLLEPVISLDAVLVVAEALCVDLCAALDARGLGARCIRLTLFRVDGDARAFSWWLTQPERAAKTLFGLVREKLRAKAETLDAAFGFESARLDAVEVASIKLRVADLAPVGALRDRQAEARLIDRIRARLGAARVGRLLRRDVHAPERASFWTGDETVIAPGPAVPEDGLPRRPLSLFAHPQPIEAIAALPDGPPMRFRWRRLVRRVVRFEGPERIAPNWLHAPEARLRDYYRIEDDQGRRYWVYREGLHGDGEETTPSWYVQGLFA